MNGTAYNNTTQTLNFPYTLIQPAIPGKQLAYETPKQLAIQHYEDFILSIMKVMDLLIGIMQFRINLPYELQ